MRIRDIQAFLSQSLRRPATIKRHWSYLLLLGILLIAAYLRWNVLTVHQSAPLFPDAGGYRHLADSLKHPLDTDIREPLWIWIIKFWFYLTGSSDYNLRLLTVTLSMILIWVVWRFAAAVSKNDYIALLTALMMGTNSYLIQMSVQGLRLEAYTIILMMYSYYLFAPQDAFPSKKWRLFGLSLYSGLSVILRMTSFTFLVLLNLYGAWRHRLGWKKLTIPIVTMLLFAAPLMLKHRHQFGDPLWILTYAATWYRNYEFLEIRKTGCPGCPTEKDWRENSDLGRPISFVNYVFKLHSLPELVQRTFGGYVRLFLWPSAIFTYLLDGSVIRWWPAVLGNRVGIFFWVYLLGLLGVLGSPFREILIVPLISINFIAYMIPLDIPPPRLIMHVAPFTSFFFACGFWMLGAGISKLIRKRIS